ncbi:Cacna1h [Symbiodinium natans]|uniref:Cacna1h protein n=1 Tax=Symbiodinium natans TaxID=878477 RepID=A0A812VGQ2_9DINO|nr:Cacna1h [Symbiodinium natans]
MELERLEPLDSWLTLGTQQSWLECPENVCKSIKLAQKSLSQGEVLLRLQISTRLPSPPEELFPPPELVESVGRLTPDPAHLFADIRVVESIAPGQATVQLTVDPNNLWFKTLAANSPALTSDEVLQPHPGCLVVRRSPSPQGSCTMLVSSQASHYLSTAVTVSPDPQDASKTLITRLIAAPTDCAYFRLKHLARMSLSLAGAAWLGWVFGAEMCAARVAMKSFYVILSIESCNYGPPLLPRTAGAKPFVAEHWERAPAEGHFAAYLHDFLRALGLGVEVFCSVDGKQLTQNQAMLRRHEWEKALPIFLPMFQMSTMAYRRLSPHGAGEPPKLLEDEEATFCP